MDKWIWILIIFILALMLIGLIYIILESFADKYPKSKLIKSLNKYKEYIIDILIGG